MMDSYEKLKEIWEEQNLGKVRNVKDSEERGAISKALSYSLSYKSELCIRGVSAAKAAVLMSLHQYLKNSEPIPEVLEGVFSKIDLDKLSELVDEVSDLGEKDCSLDFYFRSKKGNVVRVYEHKGCSCGMPGR